MPKTTIIDTYSIGVTDKTIKLKVTIENAQISKSTVRLNQKVLADKENSFSMDIGKAKDLIGMQLNVDTTETDIDPDSDKLSFRFELEGGIKAYSNYKEQSVSSGGYVYYTAEIIFLP